MKASGASSRARNDGGRNPAPSRPRTPDASPAFSRHFALKGPSIRLDPRVHAVRKDVADIALADRVFAPHYALPLVHGCVAIAEPMRAAPSRQAPAVSELLRGERFAVVDASGDWAWGYSCHDHYVGYVPIASLGTAVEQTHIVATPAALIFSGPGIKTPVLSRLPMGARLAVSGEDGDFLITAEGFVHRRHVMPLGETDADHVAVASRLTGTPYRWGGRSGDGIDCSGLVQLSLAFAGIAAPRDSDMQQALGAAVAPDAPLRRGDLLFFPGHVGMMADETHLLHANAHWMQVVTEPLADVLARLPEDQAIVAVRRLG